MAINFDKARELSALHSEKDLLVLPTVWDVWSARIIEDAGFKALTIGSHPVANSIGAEDGEAMNFDHYLAITRAIAEAVSIPVSVDVESGYGLDPATLLQRVAETGAVGLNVEDTVHGEDGRLRSAEEHAEYIAQIKQAADELDLEFVINGRTDAFKRGLEEEEGINRLKLMEEAGARAVYTVGVTDLDQITRLVNAVTVPLNVTVDPIAKTPADLDTLAAHGVRRATWGPKWQAGLQQVLTDTQTDWLK